MNDRDRELIDLMNNGTPEERVRASGLLRIYERLAEARKFLTQCDENIDKYNHARFHIWLPMIHELELLLKALGESIE